MAHLHFCEKSVVYFGKALGMVEEIPSSEIYIASTTNTDILVERSRGSV